MRLGQPDPQLKNDQNGKLTLAVLHDEDNLTLLLHYEKFLERHDVGVFHRVEQLDFAQLIDQIGWIRADLHLLSDIFLVFCFVGHQVNGPETTFAKLFVLSVLLLVVATCFHHNNLIIN